MLLGDDNRYILLSDSYAVVCRKSSIIRYSMEYSRIDILPVSLSLPRCFNGRIYDYLEDKIMSFSSDDFNNSITKEFHGGYFEDYYKQGKCFYFIKNRKDGSYTLFSREPQSTLPKEMLVFQSLYCFDDEFIFIIEDSMVVRVSLSTMSKSIVGKLAAKPSMISCRFIGNSGACGDSYTGDMIAYTDARNRLHIHYGKEYRLYHWLSNRAESLYLSGDYVIAASKSGDIVRFHSKIHRIEPLLRFDGEFVDMKIENDKLYLLSASQFLVFDLESQGLMHRETLVVPGDYRVCSILGKPPKDASNDIFGLAKQSKMEVFNSLEICDHCSGRSQQMDTSPESSDVSRVFIAYVYRRYVYLFDPAEKVMASQFLLDSDINFISNNKVLAFIRKRANMIVRVFSIFQDRLVLDSDRVVSSKDCAKITNAYYAQNKVFVEILNNLCYINRLNLIEILSKSNHPLNVIEEQDSLLVMDEKGVFDILKREYILKQKGSSNFCIFNGIVMFFMENKGIYACLPERRQVLEIRNVIDIKSEVVSGIEVLKIIHLVDGRCRVEDYTFHCENEYACLEKISDSVAENSCFRLLCNNICITKAKQMIIT